MGGTIDYKELEMLWKSETVALFHKLWGQARGDSPIRPKDYNKQDWIKLQSLLRLLGIKA